MARPATGAPVLEPQEVEEVREEVAARHGGCASGSAALAGWLGVEPPPERPSTSGYDLAGEAFDSPARLPSRSLFVAATYRSGSTLLCEALHAAGLGTPLEYFREGAAEGELSRFAGDGFERRVVEHRTTPGGLFAAKLFWPDLERLRDGGDDGLLPAALTGPVSWVWLRRRDLVAQAVSTLRALSTWRWREAAGEAQAPEPGRDFYDFGKLRMLVGLYAEQDRLWGRYLRGGREPLATVWYEELAADPPAVAGSLAATVSDALGHPAGAVPQPRLARQADEASLAAAVRFLDDLRGGREP